MIRDQTLPYLYVRQRLLLGKVKYVNDPDDVLEKRWKQLIFIDLTGRIPKTCRKKFIGARLYRGPELASRILYTDCALVNEFEIIMAKPVANACLTDS